MRIAVVGCSHGGLDTIYKTIHRVDADTKKSGELPVELLLCCGDFQVCSGYTFYHAYERACVRLCAAMQIYTQ